MGNKYLYIAVISATAFMAGLFWVAERNARSPGNTLSLNNYEQNSRWEKAIQNRHDLWLVLGNRGIVNYYVDRFSDNWIFWDACVNDKVRGISGDFGNIKNWQQLSKIINGQISYIAADFNALINHRRRNEIIEQSALTLKQNGVFCIEDDFSNREKKFEHFSKQDLEQLSKTFDISYSYYDGFVSSLPYTSSPSENKNLRLFDGLELMILRIINMPEAKVRKIMPNISTTLIKSIKAIPEKMQRVMVYDVVNSSDLVHHISEYNRYSVVETQETENVKPLQKKIRDMQIQMLKYEKILKTSKDASSTLTNLKQSSAKLKKGLKFLMGDTFSFLDTGEKKREGGQEEGAGAKKPQAENSLQNALFSKLTSMISKEYSVEGIEQQLKELKNEIYKEKNTLHEKEKYLNFLHIIVSSLKASIYRIYNSQFEKFARDKFLRKYLKYRKTALPEIISASDSAQDDFWNRYEHGDFEILDIDHMSKILEKNWNPKILLNNSVTFDQLVDNSEKEYYSTTRVVISFIKR